MRKVHLISVSEPLMLDLALALKEKGYEVSTSGCGLTEDQIHRLEVAGCVYYGDGWFPDRLVNPVYSVVLGSTVLPDNLGFPIGWLTRFIRSCWARLSFRITRSWFGLARWD